MEQRVHRELLGYGSVKNLYRLVRATTGLTPGELRRLGYDHKARADYKDVRARARALSEVLRHRGDDRDAAEI